MKRLLLILAAVLLALAPAMASAYTINGNPGATIGEAAYTVYGINAVNWTPGVDSGAIELDLFTNVPQAGVTCYGSPPWYTPPADIFITEDYYGKNYEWAIPLVSHGGFTPGTMYAVGTYLTSTQQDPSHGTGYIFNGGVPTLLATVGNNYGWTSIGGGSVTWIALAGSPDYEIQVVTGCYEDDPNGAWTITWGGMTCANDVITGVLNDTPVPIPPTVLLFSSGLLGLAGLGWRRKSVKS